LLLVLAFSFGLAGVLTVSQRFKPSSRTILLGEQPNP